MNAERALSFVDTNVLVYAFEKGVSPKKQTAQRLVSELMDEDRLRVSTQVLQELFVTLTRKAARPCTSEEALAVLEELAAWPLIVVDYAAIRAAVGLSGQQSLCEMRCIRVIHRRLERWAGDSRPSHYKPVQDRMRASECELPFGPTNPPVAAGQAFSGAASTTNPVQLSINYISVTPIFAGITSAGLYQMNIVKLPSGLGTGDVLLQAIVGGARTPSNVVISLQ